MTVDPIAFHDFEQEGWQRAAEYYPDSFGTLTMQTTEPLLDAAGIGPGMRVLEVATGPGYVAGAAAARGADVVGLDFSPLMIEEARRRYAGLTFVEGDAEALAFDAGEFDAAVMNFGVLHLARPDLAISESGRVVRRGGRFAFTVWDAPDRAVGFGVVLRAMDTHGTANVGLPDGPPFFRFSDAGECRRAMTAAGLVDIQVVTLPLVWRLPSAGALFAAALRGGVRTSAALQAQTPDALAAIRRAVHEELQRYVDGDSIALPMSVVLASGQRSQRT